MNKNYSYFKSFVWGIVAFVCVTLSLFNVFYKSGPEKLKEHKKTYKQIIKKLDAQEKIIINNHAEALIKLYPDDPKIKQLANKLAKDYENHNINFTNTIKKSISKTNTLALKHSFLGRSSFKFWLFLFGLVLLGLYFSVKSLIDDFKKETKTGHEIISVLGIAVCLFWVYHLFFQTNKDFENQTYITFEVLLSIGVAFFIAKVIQYYTIKEGVINSLINLIIRIKKEHYKKVFVKALHAETYNTAINDGETLKEQADSFDKDVLDTINNIK